MLKKKERLNREQFNRFFSTGKRFHSPLITLVYSPSPTFNVSAVAPKKVFKKAVLRNKFRRRVYDVFARAHKESLLEGVFICIAKQDAQTDSSYEVIKKDLISLIHKTGALR